MPHSQDKIAILGLGLSGRALADALQKAGRSFCVWDDNETARNALPSGTEIIPLDTPEAYSAVQTLVAAPGIPDKHPAIQAARAANVEVICDIELWHRFYPDTKTIGITGTNGKSTLTAMVRHILNDQGIKAQMGGNIGVPVFALDAPQEGEWIVLELSSFQIERCPTFRPTLSALLNITPDHLDRHGSMEAYAAIKAQLFEGQGKAVIAGSDPYSRKIAENVQAKGQRQTTVITTSGKDATQQNQDLATALAQYCGIEPQTARLSLKTFQPLPHRQCVIAEKDGVTYIDDSKATNAQATQGALQRYKNIVWIVGGVPKAGGLDALDNDLSNVLFACIIGRDTHPFAQWLSERGIALNESGTMAQAVRIAQEKITELGAQTVLLSPACASYDQYKNFMERGQDFANCTTALLGESA